MMASLKACHLVRALVRNHSRVAAVRFQNLGSKTITPRWLYSIQQFQPRPAPKTTMSFACRLLSNEASNIDRNGDPAENQEDLTEDSTKYEVEFEDWAKCLRFETSKLERGRVKGLEQYVEDMIETQEVIYFIETSSRELAETSPHCEALKRKNIEVLYVDPSDINDLNELKEFMSKPIVPVNTVKPVNSLKIVLSSGIMNPDWSENYQLVWYVKTVVFQSVVVVYATVWWFFRMIVIVAQDINKTLSNKVLRIKGRFKRKK